MAEAVPTDLRTLDQAFAGMRSYLENEFPDVGFMLIAVTAPAPSGEGVGQQFVLRTNCELDGALQIIARTLEGIAQTSAKPKILTPNG